MPGTISVLYFARLRDKIGLETESVDLPDHVQTVGDLMRLIETRSDAHADAFNDCASIRAAIDQQHADLDTALGAAREVAFFPPMTGG